MNTVVFDYTDYRAFLRDAYEELKATRPSFSYRYFARRAGIGSPSYLKLVMDGERNLSQEMARRFAVALKLNKQQTTFFVNLVAMNQASTSEERAHYYDQMSEVPKYRETKRLDRSQYDYYSRWYCVPIRELVARDDFREDPAWIARQLRDRITEREAREGLELLLRLNLVGRDEDGRLVQREALLSTGPELRSLALRQFHGEMLHRAAEAIEQVPIEDREVGGVTLRLTGAQLQLLKKRLFEFRQEILQHDGVDPGDQAVFHFAFQLFPLSWFGEVP